MMADVWFVSIRCDCCLSVSEIAKGQAQISVRLLIGTKGAEEVSIAYS